MIVLNGSLWPLVIVGATLPTAIGISRMLSLATTAHDYNVVLRRTAGLHLRFGVLASIGLLISAILGG